MIRRTITNDKIADFHRRSTLGGKCTTLRTLQQIHAHMIVKGFNSNRPHLRELIYASALVVPSGIHYAHQLFDKITEPNLFMWNAMLRGSAQSANPIKAVSLYTQMERRNISPDKYTFPCVLKACTKLCWINIGCAIHGKIVKYGFESNTYSSNTLIHFHANCGDIRIASALFDCSSKTPVAWTALTAGYAKRGELGMARKLFDEMPARNLISLTVMITAYAKRGKMEDARLLFDEAPKRDVVTWNAMIAGYVLNGSHSQALDMFEEMKDLGEQPDEVTMLNLLSACTDSGDLDVGEKLHRSVLEFGRGKLSILLGNALIDMYAKWGSIEKSLATFHSMREKNLSTWNYVILGLAFNGHSEEALSIFQEMCRVKIRPNEVSFVGALVACSHAGKVQEGRKCFSLMKDEYNVEPNERHYGCMVDLLGRAGLLDEAFDFIYKMKIKPNAIIWRTLLGACKVHNNVELGRLANEQLLRLRCEESGDYVLLSNIHASQGQWNGAERVRKSMDDSGVKKEVGSTSLVDSHNKALMHFLFDSISGTKSSREPSELGRLMK